MAENRLPVMRITASLVGELADAIAKDRGLSGRDQAKLVRDSARLPPRQAMDRLEDIVSQDRRDAE